MSLPLQTSGRCCSDLRLDQLLVGDLDDEEARALRTHLEGSPRCRERLAVLEQDRAAFAAGPPTMPLVTPHTATTAATTPAAEGSSTVTPVVAVATPTVAATASTRRPDRRWPAIAPLVAMAAGVLFTVQLARAPTTDPHPGGPDADDGVVGVDAVRTKGDAPRVQLHRKRGERVVPLGRGDAVAAGDAIRVDVATAGPRFVGVVGVDHDGAAAWIPTSGAATLVDGSVTLPTAVVLDRAPAAAGPRDVLVVVYACDAPVPMTNLVAATTTMTAPAAPAACARDVIRLERHE